MATRHKITGSSRRAYIESAFFANSVQNITMAEPNKIRAASILTYRGSKDSN
jgi:hypothetical protein